MIWIDLKKRTNKLTTKRTFTKNTWDDWYDSLIKYIPEHIKKMYLGLIIDIRALFEQEEKDYYKPTRVGNFWNTNYNEHESSGDRNKNLSVKEYLVLILNINLQKSDTWKIQLTSAINFNSSKDVDEELVMHSKSNNIKLII